MAKLKITSPVRHSGTLYMPGSFAEIGDSAVVKELVKLGVAEEVAEPKAEAKPEPKPESKTKAKTESKGDADKPAN